MSMERRQIKQLYPDPVRLCDNKELEGQYGIISDISYSAAGDMPKLSLIVPWKVLLGESEGICRPLIVFIQGSGWTTPDNHFQLPQMTQFAQAGYTVAMVVHRSFLDGYPAPAFLQDVKCAIRYLRKNALKYGIDPNRIGIWGTSSGAHIAQMVGLTAGAAEFHTEEYEEYSEEVSLVVSCFAPTDVSDAIRAIGISLGSSDDEKEIVRMFLGDDPEKRNELAAALSPVNRLEDGKIYPPFLIMHGDRDELIDYETHFVRMYHKLCEHGVSVEAYTVENAPHEGGFWSREIYEVILRFIRKNL